MPPAEYLAASYYERWLFAIETLVREKGLLGVRGR
jgi:nitrile hydratase